MLSVVLMHIQIAEVPDLLTHRMDHVGIATRLCRVWSGIAQKAAVVLETVPSIDTTIIQQQQQQFQVHPNSNGFMTCGSLNASIQSTLMEMETTMMVRCLQIEEISFATGTEFFIAQISRKGQITSIMASGVRTLEKGKDTVIITMTTYTLASGRKTNAVDKARYLPASKTDTRDSGKMTCEMAVACSLRQMEQSIQENLIKIRSTGLEK